ncbi:MAG: LAGLIDADG homing endonuclease [Candidatus Wolfebacteria bacterium GW2011_GWC1_43_10]|uniref:LAGLIDADG homing endonuclease n=2 Tax=Candidatus Wolfeibacteriota TaxID=1752735 RepID=A0A0G1CAZ4_9BACT|nr:MAG: LAGLIDADG homing endonuclease [Candidatus Wolfebacteria bacterium GW2011_GWC1_43_10]OGM90198.1 MAG: hypothetical protein A2108_01120 [Candidatus Wolfebacteria bacterium GWA1_42_9]
MGRTKPIVSADYVVGLTDGEGCFYVYVSNSPRYVGGARVGLNFYIKMNERDKNLLEKVRRSLKCGCVYFQREQRKNHTQCYRYTVGSHRDVIERIIPFFKRHSLQSDSKRKSFMFFCEIAELVESGKHLTKDGIEQIRLLKKRMNQKTVGLA